MADIAEIVISSVDKKTKPGEKIVRLCNFTDVYHNWAIKQSDYDSFMVASASDSNINKLSLKKGFVAFTKDSETRDDIGISTYIADNFDDVVLGYHCALAKPNENIVYGKYLNAFMSSDYIKKYFELNATGSGMRFTLAVSTMEDMPIMLPGLNVQKKIGNMLSDFDKRIENLRAQNRVLEQTAKTIYDYTFLQCAGHQTTYNKTLNRNIPVGWEVKKLSEIANITMGQSPEGSSYNEIGNGKIFYQGCTDFGVMFPTPRLYTTAPTRFAKVNDILMSVRAPVGTLNIANTECCIGRGLAALNAKEGSNVFLYYVMKNFENHFKNAFSMGTTFGSITKNDLYDLPVLFPDSKTLELFSMQVSPLFKKQLVNSQQIETLTTQRNTLLPLLMTGQVEV